MSSGVSMLWEPEKPTISPDSMAFLNHVSHSSSRGMDVSPDTLRRATRSRNLSFKASPTLSSSSSLSSSARSSACSFASAGVGDWDLWDLAGGRSSGGTQFGRPSPAVSRMMMPCSRSYRSFAHLVPSHFVSPVISACVSRRASKARKRRRCHVHRLRRMR